jgi:hypothetical protein
MRKTKPTDRDAKPAGVRFADGVWTVSFRKYLGAYLAYRDAEQVRRYMEHHHATTAAENVVAAYERAVQAGHIPAKLVKGSSNVRYPRTGKTKKTPIRPPKVWWQAIQITK